MAATPKAQSKPDASNETPDGYIEDYLVVTNVPEGRGVTDGSYADAVALGVELVEEYEGADHFCIRKRYMKVDS